MFLNENMKAGERDVTYFKKVYFVIRQQRLRKATEHYEMVGI
jgi:hypothetical protein